MKSIEKQITETIPEFFFVWDLNANEIIHLTDTFDKLSVKPKDKANLNEIKNIIADDELGKFDKAFEEIKNGKYYQDVELQTDNVFNGTRWINMKTYPVYSDNGEIDNVAGQFLDITEKKNRQKKIQKQSEDIEDILHIIAHDIRGPLGNILNIARAQKTREKEDFKVLQNFSSLIEKIADNTLVMMESMIEAVKVTSEGFHIDPSSVNINSFIENICTAYNENLHEKGLKLTTSLPNTDAKANIDEVKFRLVLQNLITNAIKFTPNNGEIKVSVEVSNQNLQIAVSDNGIGIPPENKKKIFEKFSSVRKDGVRGEKSFGLGLAISKKIVELHMGTIHVDSEPGKGTTFTIVLPVK